MLYHGFLAGHLPTSVAERLTAISEKNAEHFGLLMAEFWEAHRNRDYERADRLTVQMAPFLAPILRFPSLESMAGATSS